MIEMFTERADGGLVDKHLSTSQIKWCVLALEKRTRLGRGDSAREAGKEGGKEGGYHRSVDQRLHHMGACYPDKSTTLLSKPLAAAIKP